MLAAEGDPNATSQQKKEWRALFHKAKIEYEKLASSEESVGDVRLRQFAKCMVQRGFRDEIGRASCRERVSSPV